VRRIKQRRRIVIMRDDHIGDALGLMFVDPGVENEDSILERLCEYLGRHVRVVKAELTSERAEVEVEFQSHVDEAARLAAAAHDLHQKGMRRNALALFREALELDPLNRDAAMGLGLMLADGEQYADALKMLKRARESGNDDANLLYEMGRLCAKLERTASAILYLERAVELDPSHFGARRALSEMGRQPKPLQLSDSQSPAGPHRDNH
jgi:tetratricopeptide (TPR) repeat protein